MASSDSGPDFHPLSGYGFGRTIMHPPEKLKVRKKRRVQIKLKSHVVIKCRLIRVLNIILRP